jgi:transposase
VVIDFSKKYNIQIEDWSPYTPNLNPIKHVWAELKRRIHRKYPDIHQRKVFYSLGASRSV